MMTEVVVVDIGQVVGRKLIVVFDLMVFGFGVEEMLMDRAGEIVEAVGIVEVGIEMALGH